MFNARRIGALLILLICCWIGWKSYGYFYDTGAPIFTITGIEESGYCSGDAVCTISGNDAYKVESISVWLDEKPILSNFKINRKQFEYSLPIPTKTLNNGKHTLKVSVRDASYKKNTTNDQRSFNVDNAPLQAALIRPDLEYRVFQGRTLHIQFQVSKEIQEATIQVLSKTYLCFQEVQGMPIYECFVPIDCEGQPNEYPFVITIKDKVGNSTTLEGKFQVLPYPFKKQTLTLSNEKVAEEKEIGIPQDQLEQQLEILVAQSPKQKLWHGSFYVPIDMTKISCDYGTTRTTQEKGCYMHKALDILGAPRSVVWAPQDGIVIVKDRFVQSGNTVVIDHGCGIFSLLFHLDNFADIHVGDKLKRGNPVGALGKTGFATGYHLHWEMRIWNIPTYPLDWTKTNF